MPKAKVAKTLGEITRGSFYPLRVFSQRIGWGRHAMRAARKGGLKVIYMHGTAGVRGDAFFDYLDSINERGDVSE